MVSIYLPPLVGLLSFVQLDGLWGDVRAPLTSWRAARKPRQVLWTPAPRPPRAVWD